MTEPGFVPPLRNGWWVKKGRVLFPAPAALTLTGGQPSINAPTVLQPAPAILTLTGGSPALAPRSFVTRDATTGNLMLDGQRYRFAGANMPGLGYSEGSAAYGSAVFSNSDSASMHYSSHSEIDAALDTAQAMNINVITCWGAVQSTGTPQAVQPTLGVFNAAALEPTDYLLQQLNIRGMKMIANVVGNYTYPGEGSKFWYCTQNGVTPDSVASQFFTNTTIINSLKAHISFCLNHVNQYTGVAYKDDPAWLAWGTGGEMSLSPNDPQWTTSCEAWTDTIAQHIKVTCGAKQLVSDGHCSIYSDNAKTVLKVNTLTNPYVDMFQSHPYSKFGPPHQMHSVAQIAHSYGKAWFFGEYPWTDLETDRFNSLEWRLTDLLSIARGSPYIDGLQFWELYPPLQFHGDQYGMHFPADSANAYVSKTQMNNRGIQIADNAAEVTSATIGRNPPNFYTVAGSSNNTNGAVDYRGILFNSGTVSYIYTPKVDDLIVLAGAALTRAGINPTPGSGWFNLVGSGQGAQSDVHTLATFGYWVTAADVASWNDIRSLTVFTAIAYGDAVGFAIRGVDRNNPINAVVTAANAANTTGHVLPGLSQASSQSLVMSCVASNGTTSYSSPDGWSTPFSSNYQTGMWLGFHNRLTTGGAGVAATSITAGTAHRYAAITVAFNAKIQPVVPILTRVPNRYVGPMALRAAFRTAQPWASSTPLQTDFNGSASTDITVGLTADGVVGLVGSANMAITAGLVADGVNPTNVIAMQPAATVPTRNVGPMALRNSFRRAQQWLDVNNITFDGGDPTGTGPDTFDFGDPTGTGSDIFDGGSPP